MAVKLTEKENFMKCINGETPDWVPRYYMGVDPYSTVGPQCMSVMSSFNGPPRRTENGFFDMWGVEYVATAETGWQSLPKPNDFILDDIRNWRDVIKVPDISEIDWDLVAKRDEESRTFNPADVATMGGGGGGFFMNLMNFMGFTNGLIAMFEEPDEVHAMFDYMCTYFEEVVSKVLPRYPIDIFTVGDDTATATNPFISPLMYRELVKPYTARVAKLANEKNMPVMMHDCGRCEDSIEDWRDFGVNSWNPAQIVNDLKGIKEKYGNELVLIGCWDSQGPAGWDTCTEELMRSEVRKTIDAYAANGGFMFWGSTYGPADDQGLINRRQWMTSEYEAYREVPYK